MKGFDVRCYKCRAFILRISSKGLVSSGTIPKPDRKGIIEMPCPKCGYKAIITLLGETQYAPRYDKVYFEALDYFD